MRPRWYALLGLLVAALVLAAYFFRERAAPERAAEVALPNTTIRSQTFPTWDDFLKEHRSPRSKVVFIGIDGAAWNIIDPMIEQGLLPAMEQLKKEGSFGVLRSVACYVSPPAWTSMMTGYIPDHTGIYTFGHWDRAARRFVTPRSTDIQVPSVWDIASLAAYRTAVVNVPMTFPVRPITGLMVSGLMTPSVVADAQLQSLRFSLADEASGSFSRPLVAHTSYAGGDVTFRLVDSSNDNVVNHDRVIVTQRVDGADVQTSTVGEFSVSDISPWLRMQHVDESGARAGWVRVRMQQVGASTSYVVHFSPLLFAIEDTETAAIYPADVAHRLEAEFGYYFPSVFMPPELITDFTADAVRFATYFERMDDWDLFMYVFTQTDNIQHLDGASPVTQQVYQRVDRFLGDLVTSLPRDTHLVIASDHGFKEYRFSIDINKLLERVNLLRFGADGRVDFARSVVFHNLWCLYFNRELLTRDEFKRRGIDLPAGETPDAFLTKFLQDLGRSLTYGERAMPIELIAVDSSAPTAPDMIATGTYSDYLIEFWNISRPKDEIIRTLGANETWNHTRDGVVMAYGPTIRKGHRIPDTAIENMAATLLYLLGLPVAENMDGRVVSELFDGRTVQGEPLFVVRGYEHLPSDSLVSTEQRESLEKKLRNLGYIR